MEMHIKSSKAYGFSAGTNGTPLRHHGGGGKSQEFVNDSNKTIGRENLQKNF
jgi:hypothetical protein